MAEALDKILSIVRETSDFDSSWERILNVCRKDRPSYIWDRLPKPNFSRDVEQATTWLTDQLLRLTHPPRGIYLGLDTLNMESGSQKNVEIGFSMAADPAKPTVDFLQSLPERGEDHLIRSLIPLKRVYDKTEISRSADYKLFLAYTGLVLLAVFERISIENDYVAVWGFHDGDIFFLIRQLKGKKKRLIKL